MMTHKSPATGRLLEEDLYMPPSSYTPLRYLLQGTAVMVFGFGAYHKELLQSYGSWSPAH